MINHIDLQTEKFIINKFIKLPNLLNDLDIDYRFEGNFFCPFHHNENTPSARLYKEDGNYCIWCFSEGRFYNSWNVYKEFCKNINTKALALYILNQLSPDEQKHIYDSIGNDFNDDFNIPYESYLKDFKQNKISISNLIKFISTFYIDET